MFITTCLECHNGDSGKITGVNRVDEDDPVCKKCGAPNYLVYTNRQAYGGSGGDYNFCSQALAMQPSQIAAHKKLFPHVEVTDDGRPIFKSVRQREKYNDAIGMVKRPAKIKRRGKRIA